jgi:hypothetical protein
MRHQLLRSWCWWCLVATVICVRLVAHVVFHDHMGDLAIIALSIALTFLFKRVHGCWHDDDHRKRRPRPRDTVAEPTLVAPAMTRQR